MSNLPILYFTLGALVGLPAGYWFAWFVDADNLWVQIWALLFGIRRTEVSLSVLIAMMDEIDRRKGIRA